MWVEELILVIILVGQSKKHQTIGVRVHHVFFYTFYIGKFDDDKVSQVSQEDITKLEGGGDWHTAYMCLYRAKKLE